MDLITCPHKILLCEHDLSGCSSPQNCKSKAHIICTCIFSKKIPTMELRWLYSQRNKTGEKSDMQMGHADKIETTKLRKKYKRKISDEKAYEKRMKKLQDDQASFEVTEKQDIELHEEYQKNISPDISLKDNYNPVNVNFTLKQDNEIKLLVERLLKDKLGVYAFLVTRFLEKKSRKNTMSIKNTAMASIRFGISPAATAAIATSYLQDLIEAGFLTPEYSYLACDPSKLMRARKKVMVVAKNNDHFNLPKADNIGIYFDGRKNSTRAMINDSSGQLHSIIIKEQHITVTIEPGGRYLGHFTSNAHTHSDKPAKKIAEGVYNLLQQYNLTESCLVLGADSTSINTGWKGGAITHLEKLLGHKCNWAICMLHSNKLFLRHLIEGIDGLTSCSTGFVGPVGKCLADVNKMEYNPQFKALPEGESFVDIPETILKNMSTDQKQTYKLCKAVKIGVLPPNLREIQCGPLSHARWLTTGMRIVFMWTRKHDLTDQNLKNLELLVLFCLQFYFKLFFDIKVKDRLEDASNHILSQLRILRNQPVIVREIVTPYIQLGAWYANYESLLISLLSSNNAEDRNFAVDRILEQRGNDILGDMRIRPRKTPKLNFAATTLKELVKWENGVVQEPVFTCSLTKDKLIMLRLTPLITPSVKIHTQSTKRAVKQVTVASMSVVGPDARDGYIRARAQHRELLPVFKTKKEILINFQCQ
ncbi:uncharacterized protein LOC136077054 [Hydra vulgaris]|uniref:Uncharacterized protein LOC136077054 n=1 Tax=Hydra vulgaris TaxID=6087 RepID=A0ABM4BF05_HYDVU